VKTAEVMFVMPVSIVVTVEVPDNATADDAIDAAAEELPGHNSAACGWDSSDPEAFGPDGKPYMITIDGEAVTS
jgi:hypothetical protein